jgi:hypothetical protein
MLRRYLVLGCGICLFACYGSVEPPGPLRRAPLGDAHAADAEAETAPREDPVGAGALNDGFADELTSGPGVAATTGCTKIDFLFVVDNSGSMAREQESLSNSFPGFMQVIERQVEGKDFHIMVVDTDGPSSVETSLANTSEPSSELRCDVQIGAGRRLDSSGADCGLRGGMRFMSPEQPDLTDTFTCVAQVGTDGSDYEQPVRALLRATSAPLTGDGCNAQFLRRDAMLVVTLVTDEDDTLSPGDPESWRSELLAVKGGDPESVVILALVGDDNREQALPGGPCSSVQAEGSPLLQQFAQSFPFGSMGAVCADDYAPFFEKAVAVVGQACSRFVAPTIR